MTKESRIIKNKNKKTPYDVIDTGFLRHAFKIFVINMF